MGRGEKTVRVIGMTAGLLFAAITIGMLLVSGRYARLPVAILTPLLLAAPVIVERLFRCHIALPVYVFALAYAVGPMLGHCYNFYYHIPWWDKMLHVFGGVMFALLGLFLFQKFLDPTGKKRAMAAVFALCFSMAVAVAWEFFEYGADTFLGMDMQDDTVITEITSYLLDGAPGEVGTIENIATVTVNGKPLPVKGYIDIGLNDTMWDMLLETLGTLVVIGWFVRDKGKHAPFRSVK